MLMPAKRHMILWFFNSSVIVSYITEKIDKIERESIDAKLKDKDSNYSLKGKVLFNMKLEMKNGDLSNSKF